MVRLRSALTLAMPWFVFGCSRNDTEARGPEPQLVVRSSAAIGQPISPILPAPPLDPAQLAIGRRLFADVRLSHDRSVACATCHDLRRGGTDGLPQSIGAHGRKLQVNTPTVFNSALGFRQLWDGRAETIEDSVDDMLESAMGGDSETIAGRLAEDPEYQALFAGAFSDEPSAINYKNIRDALSVFLRSLATPRSRFDRYLSGEQQALSDVEVAGYRLFINQGCVRCHQGAAVGGNLFHHLGGPRRDAPVLKVPSLRNVALTAPYFHDGSAATLEDAIDATLIRQIGRTLDPHDRDAIAAFLRTLTGEYEGRRLEPES